MQLRTRYVSFCSPGCMHCQREAGMTNLAVIDNSRITNFLQVPPNARHPQQVVMHNPPAFPRHSVEPSATACQNNEEHKRLKNCKDNGAIYLRILLDQEDPDLGDQMISKEQENITKGCIVRKKWNITLGDGSECNCGGCEDRSKKLCYHWVKNKICSYQKNNVHGRSCSFAHCYLMLSTVMRGQRVRKPVDVKLQKCTNTKHDNRCRKMFLHVDEVSHYCSSDSGSSGTSECTREIYV